MKREQYITKEYGQHNRRVVLLLAGWKTRLWMYWLPAKILTLNGYYCIVYAYDDDVFSPDAQQTVASLTSIRDAIVSNIAQLKAQGRQDFSILSFSLGATIGFMAANASPDISKAVFNLTGTGPAEAAWTWDAVEPDFKQALLKQHYSLPSLTEAWKTIAPTSNIGNLQGKKLLIYLAKHDRLIPYAQGQELVRKIDAAGYEYQLVTNNYGSHAFAGAYNLVNARIYLKFLRDK